MATFAYSGRTRAGEIVNGERMADIDGRRRGGAPPRADPRHQDLAGQGQEPTQREEDRPAGKNVSAKNLAVFTRQFSVMIDAGLPLVQCLDILGSQEEDKNFAGRHSADAHRRSNRARRWPTRCASIPKTFDPLFTNMVAAGEAGGILDTILKRLATYIEKAVKLNGQVKSAMIYPVAVMVIAAPRRRRSFCGRSSRPSRSCSPASAPNCRCRPASSSG